MLTEKFLLIGELNCTDTSQFTHQKIGMKAAHFPVQEYSLCQATCTK